MREPQRYLVERWPAILPAGQISGAINDLIEVHNFIPEMVRQAVEALSAANARAARETRPPRERLGIELIPGANARGVRHLPGELSPRADHV